MNGTYWDFVLALNAGFLGANILQAVSGKDATIATGIAIGVGSIVVAGMIGHRALKKVL